MIAALVAQEALGGLEPDGVLVHGARLDIWRGPHEGEERAQSDLAAGL